jgi:hypothetical protein
LVKIETIKNDLERYFINKDGKEMPLDARSLAEIKEGIKYTRGPDKRTVNRILSYLREWGIIPMPEELLTQMTPEEEARYRKKIRSQMIGRLGQEKKMKSLDHQHDKHKKNPTINPKQKVFRSYS